MAHTTHWNTHVYFMEATQDTHTHTHTHTRNVRSALHPSRTVLPPGPPRSSGQLLSARGPSEPSVSVTDGQENVLFLHVFPVGVPLEETPCEHGENMQTPHRKTREIAHLSLGRTYSAPCRNRGILAVKRQCKHLSHRATCILTSVVRPYGCMD